MDLRAVKAENGLQYDRITEVRTKERYLTQVKLRVTNRGRGTELSTSISWFTSLSIVDDTSVIPNKDEAKQSVTKEIAL